jgi:hypothetical protein
LAAKSESEPRKGYWGNSCLETPIRANDPLRKIELIVQVSEGLLTVTKARLHAVPHAGSVDYPSPYMYPDDMPDDTRSIKRRSERRRVQIAVTLVIEGNEAEHFGNTIDLSTHGLRLQSQATLGIGQSVGLLLGSEPNCFVKARVVWVGKVDPAQAGQAGFEFLGVLPGPVC